LNKNIFYRQTIQTCHIYKYTCECLTRWVWWWQ